MIYGTIVAAVAIVAAALVAIVVHRQSATLVDNHRATGAAVEADMREWVLLALEESRRERQDLIRAIITAREPITFGALEQSVTRMMEAARTEDPAVASAIMEQGNDEQNLRRWRAPAASAERASQWKDDDGNDIIPVGME